MTTTMGAVGSAGYLADAAVTPPSVSVLTFVDAGDGTGGTFTIAGSDVGTTNTVYVSEMTHGAAWSSAGSRSGDGDIVATMNPGYYLAYNLSVDGVGNAVASEPIVLSVTTGSDSLMEQILDAVKGKVNVMGLTDSASDAISAVVEIPPIFRTVGTAQVKVFPDGDDLAATHAAANEGKFRVNVALCEKDASEAQREKHLSNRETILNSFVGSRLAGLTSVYCEASTSSSAIDLDWLMEHHQNISVVTLVFRKVIARL